MNTKAQTTTDPTIREIGGPAEMRAVEELQRIVWGVPDLDVVPLTQLVAAKAAGGILVGAFDGASLVGFAYGFPGLENGKHTHHSHMLAVLPEYRCYGLGYRLKLAQREHALTKGIDEMTWTFDPLQSLNAHFNFERLGVISDKYFVDFYGNDASSFLHQTGTDRLWVTWPLTAQRVLERIDGKPSAGRPEVSFPVVEHGPSGEPIVRESDGSPSAGCVVIEIPSDIRILETKDGKLAARWREATRQAFSALIGSGFTVVGFARGEKCGKYILERR